MYYNYEKCPICGNKLNEESYYDCDIHTTVEYHKKCSKCNYEEEYAYGYYRDGIDGGCMIDYAYNYKPSKIELKRYKKKLWSYRKFLLRIHKIKGKYNRI